MGERVRGGRGGWGRVRPKSIQTEVCVGVSTVCNVVIPYIAL